MIENIENRRRDVFMETFDGIKDQFQRVYEDLTGGEGTLGLEDHENIDSGLLIQASPGGKKLITIDAMSGGEKTMTALAFLFAIQRFRKYI